VNLNLTCGVKNSEPRGDSVMLSPRVTSRGFPRGDQILDKHGFVLQW